MGPGPHPTRSVDDRVVPRLPATDEAEELEQEQERDQPARQES